MLFVLKYSFICNLFLTNIMKIVDIRAREMLDSRGCPTVEADVVLDDGTVGTAMVPSGASKGKGEACELRDGDKKRFGGKGVLKAISNIHEYIRPKLLGMDAFSQRALDERMIKLDGTDDKSELGANAILSVSIAAMRAAAAKSGMPLYSYVSKLIGSDPGWSNALQRRSKYNFVMPMVNVINGGEHADNRIDIQESMLVPCGGKSFSESVRMVCEVFYNLKSLLKKSGHSVNVGDEGGFAPDLQDQDRVMYYLSAAIKDANYTIGKDISFALDVAASSLYSDGCYTMSGHKMSSSQLVDYYLELVKKYPIISIEDGMAEDDYDGWRLLSSKLGEKVQLVGDDLYVTNMTLLRKYVDVANAVLIKYNQVGSITETLDAIVYARQNNHGVVVSHRSGDTEDTTISHIAMGVGADYIKAGAVSRSERVAKYNEIMRHTK